MTDKTYCIVCGAPADEADEGCALNAEDVDSDAWEEDNCLALGRWFAAYRDRAMTARATIRATISRLSDGSRRVETGLNPSVSGESPIGIGVPLGDDGQAKTPCMQGIRARATTGATIAPPASTPEDDTRSLR